LLVFTHIGVRVFEAVPVGWDIPKVEVFIGDGRGEVHAGDLMWFGGVVAVNCESLHAGWIGRNDWSLSGFKVLTERLPFKLT